MPEVEHIEGQRSRHRKSDGTAIDVEIYSRPFTYGGRPAWLTVVHDVTEQQRAAEELSRTKKFLDAVIEHVPVPIVVRDLAGTENDARDAPFHHFNRAYEELTGDMREHLIGKTAGEIYPPARAEAIVASDNETIHSGRVMVVPEHAIETASGETRLVTAKKRIIHDGDGRPEYLLTVLDDVTERRRAEQRIAYLAHNDSLTNLPNRATFVEYLDTTLAQAAKTGETFAILCVDLDRFKEANDIYGHLVGDELLREAARRLHEAAAGQFVARVGGDEFTLVLSVGTQAQSAGALSERLLAAFNEPFELDGQRLQTGVTIGGAVYPADGDTATTLIANADAALYQAKSEARGSMRLFDAKIGARLHDRRELQFALQAALSRNEFFLHYQPQMKLASGEMSGFEALVRWQSPVRGRIEPGEFIPIAEETGLIIPLGDWILREACREAASWPRPLKVAVNISPVQFHAGDLAAKVHRVLLETGLPPSRLELEITEGVLIDDFQHTVSILRKLKSLGVQIAMDDFGKGYCSLSYLHSFAFDKIKIDRSFVSDIETNHHSMAIVRAIIMLGHSLEVPVLAEGVETESQRLLLIREGCDDAQGYLIGRPLPAQAYAAVVGREIETLPNSADRASA
jgi:diguanylate cyclase (GGDEF)-like protein/PAS domain S-box-containing protein